MSFVNLKKTSQGFSLVELMVVVAIIGIIATIAVPSFLKFQAKAKQANAKSELASYYKAQKAFYAEHNQYHSNLPYVGFVPDSVTLLSNNCPNSDITNWSKRYYLVGANGVLTIGSPLSSRHPLPGTHMPCIYPPGATDLNRHNGIIFYNMTENTGLISAGGAFNEITGVGVLNNFINATISAVRFDAVAIGVINGIDADIWIIDDNKNLRNAVPGL